MSEKKEKDLEGLSPQQYAEYKKSRRNRALLATALGVGALGAGAYAGVKAAPAIADKIKDYRDKKAAEKEEAKPALEKRIDALKEKASGLKREYVDPITKQFK